MLRFFGNIVNPFISEEDFLENEYDSQDFLKMQENSEKIIDTDFFNGN